MSDWSATNYCNEHLTLACQLEQGHEGAHKYPDENWQRFFGLKADKSERRLLAAERLAEAAEEVLLQLEYLDSKWATGTTPAVTARLRSALSAWKEASK